MEPYKQGKLDGLCGVYSIINSARIIHELTLAESEELFNEIISYLDCTKNLSKILTEGLNINVIGEVFNNVSELNINRKMPFSGQKEAGLPEFWSSMLNFLSRTNRVVLLALGGFHDHWSVIKDMSDKRINFFDSDGIKFLNREHCTTQAPDKKRIHQLFPTHTYFLQA